MKIEIPISPAELLDKIAILEIKNQKITDPEKLVNVQRELATLREVSERTIEFSSELTDLFNRLRDASRKGWEIEDIKRDCEARGDFSDRFIEAARGAYKNNDQRAEIWKEINMLLKSDVVQEKSYKSY